MTKTTKPLTEAVEETIAAIASVAGPEVARDAAGARHRTR